MQEIMIYWQSIIPPEPQQPQPGQKTIGSDAQFCCPDDGRKDARNMLRNN